MYYFACYYRPTHMGQTFSWNNIGQLFSWNNDDSESDQGKLCECNDFTMVACNICVYISASVHGKIVCSHRMYVPICHRLITLLEPQAS